MYLDKIFTLAILLIFINLLFVIFFRRISNFFNIYDFPDYKRKIHKAPVALLGGVIIYFNILISIIFVLIDQEFNFMKKFLYINNYKTLVVFLFVMSSIFILGYLDDRKNLSPPKSIIYINNFYIFYLCK